MSEINVEITKRVTEISVEIFRGGLPLTATLERAGIVQLASTTEVAAGTNNTKAITPATLKPELDKKADNETQDLVLIFENKLI